MAALRKGDAREAERLLLEAIAFAERVGDFAELAKAHNKLGIASTRARRFRDAERHFLRARELHACSGARADMAVVELNLGGVYYYELGDLERARAVYRSALRTFEQTGHARGTAAVRTSLGAIDLVDGRPEEAIASLDAAIALWKEARDTTHLAYSLHLRAMAGLDVGEPLDRVACFIVEHDERVGPEPLPIARIRREVAAVRQAVRSPSARVDATGLIAALDAHRERVGPEDGAAIALLEAARAARARGDDVARAWALRALELVDGVPLATRTELEQLAGLAEPAERPN
jgi:tetratricopeptide (TPR) repeat protein